ncbi:alpha/beta hydrolase [Micromonospora endophytica]|uniref:Alpha/beta hydrolase n=1 Tax=Micromonospora endophytica TaxID=515350 RepID=A0A2W2DJ03_9ACTN|nr:alpha/beta hydrolase [Micromonospora endophytica]PZG00790.1 alpha/beta hydrolase [Micromonospora endophytica]RIW42087.1 alpha/beta hydrolase [Micromonospora endophytica]BCJ59646.1 alpha/beta hydrolase [Micromonospora endophytica]
MSTIVLIHGLWVTPRSWEQWIPYYEAQGHTVVAPAYPSFEVEVEALRADPTPIATVTVPETLAHLEKVINALPEKPILIGHSFGGTLTQLLLDRGHGAAGVVIGSAPPEGIRVTPPSQIKSLFPILNNPAKRHQAAGFTPEQWHYAFCNTLSEEESRAAYDRYAIPAPGSWVWAYGLIANFKPGKQETWVDFHNNERAPLLFIGGGADHIMPPSVNKSNANHYKAPDTITEYHEFPGRSHWTCAEPGWEAVADKALGWALQHAR